jgi:ATP-dependent DNA helicase RecG
MGYSTRTGNFKKALTRLLALGRLEMTIPGKPRSSKQRYKTTALGRKALAREKRKG